MPASRPLWLLLCCCCAAVVDSGQRFRLQDDEIVKADLADDAPAMSKAEAGVAAVSPAAAARRESVVADPGDLQFYRAWFDDSTDEGLVQLGNESAFGDFPSPTALAVLMKKSIFSLSTTGKVFERFHNQVKWVYVKHENPSEAPLIALTAVRNRGTYFASDSEGRVFQRLRVENGLGWMDVTSAEDHRIYLGGVPSTEGNVFFVAEDGRLLERQFDQTRSNVGGLWSDHGSPDGIKLVACVDAHTLSYGSVFAIGADGHLYMLDTAEEIWHDHGLADGSPLAPLPGVALQDLNAVGSLFLRTQEGKLVERWWDANSRKKAWHWISHGHPPDSTIVSAPGSLINGLSIFMTGSSGSLHERFWNSKEWVRLPPHLTAPPWLWLTWRGCGCGGRCGWTTATLARR